jgi:hypothetical protein
LLFCFGGMGCQYVVQNGLKLAVLLLHPPGAGITGAWHHAQLTLMS